MGKYRWNSEIPKIDGEANDNRKKKKIKGAKCN